MKTLIQGDSDKKTIVNGKFWRAIVTGRQGQKDKALAILSGLKDSLEALDVTVALPEFATPFLVLAATNAAATATAATAGAGTGRGSGSGAGESQDADSGAGGASL